MKHERWENDREKKKNKKNDENGSDSVYKNYHAVVMLTLLVHGNFKYICIEA